MKLHRYVDHQRLHIVTKDVISLSISVLLLFRHYISHKITFGAPSSGGVLCSACGAFIYQRSRSSHITKSTWHVFFLFPGQKCCNQQGSHKLWKSWKTWKITKKVPCMEKSWDLKKPE